MNWILFGFKGAGKTYFGSQLNLPFIDTDQLIEKKVDQRIREFVKKNGEKIFREIEQEVITNLTVQGYVIATGGGSILNPVNLEHLQSLGQLIYLDCPKSILKKRGLPLFYDDFETMYSERIQKYQTIPAIRIDMQGKTNSQILEELWQVINLDKSLKSPPGESLTAGQSES